MRRGGGHLDGGLPGVHVIVKVMSFYPSFEAIYPDAVPYLLRHILAGMLSDHFAEIDEKVL